MMHDPKLLNEATRSLRSEAATANAWAAPAGEKLQACVRRTEGWCYACMAPARIRGTGLAPLLAPGSHGVTWDAVADRRGEDVRRIERALAAALVAHPVEAQHQAISGFSDGASYALSLGLANADLFTHIVAFSPGSLLAGPRVGMPWAFVSHGLRDSVLPIDDSHQTSPKPPSAGYSPNGAPARSRPVIRRLASPLQPTFGHLGHGDPFDRLCAVDADAHERMADAGVGRAANITDHDKLDQAPWNVGHSPVRRLDPVTWAKDAVFPLLVLGGRSIETRSRVEAYLSCYSTAFEQRFRIPGHRHPDIENGL